MHARLAARQGASGTLMPDGSRADVLAKDQKKKNTPLHVACEKGFVDCIKLLAEAGSDLKLRNKAGELPAVGEESNACGPGDRGTRRELQRYPRSLIHDGARGRVCFTRKDSV